MKQFSQVASVGWTLSSHPALQVAGILALGFDFLVRGKYNDKFSASFESYFCIIPSTEDRVSKSGESMIMLLNFSVEQIFEMFVHF